MADDTPGVEFEIRVAGPVAAHVLAELENIRVVSEGPETVLRGPVRDQAALVGIINRLNGCGIELRGIRQLRAPPGTGGRTTLPGVVEARCAEAMLV